jgi:ketosteroid isomerase-like protein
MDPELERTIRESYAAFAAGDVERATAAFSSDASLVNPDYAMETGVREGLASLRQGLTSLLEQFEYQSLEIEEMLERPGGVLVVSRMRATGRASGAPIDERFTHVLRISDGRVKSWEWFRTREEGLAALGGEASGG